MSQTEMEQITDHFDPYENGYVDLSEIAAILRGYHKIRFLKRLCIPITPKMDIGRLEDLSMKLMIPLMCYFLLHGEMYVILGK